MGKKEKQGKKNQKEAQYYKSVTGMQMLNYKVYHMSIPERIAYFVLAFGAGAFVGYFTAVLAWMNLEIQQNLRIYGIRLL